MKDIFYFLRKNDIGEPPWEYDFLVNLDEKEYPKYLAKIFNYRTGEKLPLKYDFKNRAWIIDKKKCKTFNQKIQWIKLYGVTDLMIKCTDKVAVRDYVKEIIGEEYLKPVLQIIGSPSADGRGDRIEGSALANNDVPAYFDQINWEKLPKAFVLKCNHGSKWQYIIKDKEHFLNTTQLFDIVKQNMTGWLEQNYSFWNGFEMQYKTFASPNSNHYKTMSDDNYSYSIVPKILIEPLLREELNTKSQEIHVYICCEIIELIVKVHNYNKVSVYDKNLNNTNDIFSIRDINLCEKADENIMRAVSLSQKLSKNFNFVRVDWMLFQNKLFFEELTFTPNSGFYNFINNEENLKFCKNINLN